MNPLCCIAPVSVDYAADYHHHQPRNVAAATLSAPPEAAPPQPTPPVVSGVLHKWVNYGKGWRSRWFVLEDGVLSYYKLRDGGGESGESSASTAAARLIGEGDALRRAREDAAAAGKQWKPFGDIHLKVSSIRASRSDDKRLYIFSGTKTLHLRCETEEDRNAWLEALLVAKDRFPRSLMTNDFAPVADIMLSTEKLRMRLLHEGLNETVVNECESIMMTELLELHSQIKSQQQQHSVLVDRLRQLETEKVELERTVVHETKEREAHGYVNGRYSDFYSVLSGGSASESDPDTTSQVADAESDEDEVTYFDTRDFLSVESLRSASRRRELVTNGCNALESIADSRSYTAKFTKYPIVKRRDKLPEPKEKEKPIGLWSIIKENIGKDLSGVCLPVYFNEPLSSLQKCFEDLEYSYLVDNALQWGKQGNSLMRTLLVAAFAVSSYASTEGRQCKPFNPLLGETYEADYPDKGLRFFSEKVHGFVQDNITGEKVAMLIGKWDEAMYYVLGDPSTKPKWYDPMSEAVLLWERDKSLNQTRYNLSPFAISLNELAPHMLTMLPPTDSRLRPDQRHLENGEYEKANSEKLRLEQLQRQARRLQERGWQPRWFRKDEDDSYCYLGGYWEAREKGIWNGIPHIFGQSSASPE
ncbi:oxysterol-binding protein-related protein 1D-like isoform X2 [Hordeum vulgare subsp. vulgare]|uniref:oxysterol-binding protein-related protein 1D-like isoform X2 n=1 Tax=Hordeum vulgare subsp. vulgare TaxID=112509 RepID=UPI001D1A52C3|nr:oxysterol-binding protein-related protein 1D-like isoform X2 [Hordeum vulgare subsp. vulgare]